MPPLPRLLAIFADMHRSAACSLTLHNPDVRRKLQQQADRVLEAADAEVSPLYAARVLYELDAAGMHIPDAARERLVARAAQGGQIGRARALLVRIDDGEGCCRDVEVSLEPAGEAGAQCTTRLAEDAALQANRVVGVAARNHLLPAGRRQVLWDLVGTRACELSGPSLGVALLAAVWSAARGVVIPESWAFTGAFASQSGQVVSVGSLHAKLEAASAGQLRRVILPAADLQPELVAAFPELQLQPVATLEDLLGLLEALAPAPAETPMKAPTRRWPLAASLAVLPVAGWLAYDPPQERDWWSYPISVVLIDTPTAPPPPEPCLDDLLARGARPRDAGLVCTLRRAADARMVVLDLALTDGYWQGAARDELLAAVADLRARGVPIYAPRAPGVPLLLHACPAEVAEPGCVDGLLQATVREGSDDPLPPVDRPLSCVSDRPTLGWAAAAGLAEPGPGLRERAGRCKLGVADRLSPLPSDRCRWPWRTTRASDLLAGRATGADPLDAAAALCEPPLTLRDQIVLIGGDYAAHDVFTVPTLDGGRPLLGVELHAWIAAHLYAPEPR